MHHDKHRSDQRNVVEDERHPERQQYLPQFVSAHEARLAVVEKAAEEARRVAEAQAEDARRRSKRC
jgi:hypothetical protein